MSPYSRDAQSAESKAWDFRNANCFLGARADLLEQCEQKAWELLHMFDSSIPVPRVAYNREFSIRELEKSIASLLQLSTLDTGEKFKQSLRKTAVEMLSGISPLPEREKLALLEESQEVK